MIGIIDLDCGNIQAIRNIYKRLNIETATIRKTEDFNGISKLILPGVGAFDDVMESLNQSGMRNILDHFVLSDHIPILGICVGMQIMAKKSMEGQLDGLGWFDAEVLKFDVENIKHKPKIPHMGWNTALPKNKEHKILNDINIDKGFYFLHSFYFNCHNPEDILTSSTYGKEFSSSVNKDNIFGFQFHPEKSHSNGIAIFKNFAEL
ncbi:imidazole glycerol phosphate synthase subunit HisH [Endozoicomonadaceae bacterium StTr2]